MLLNCPDQKDPMVSVALQQLQKAVDIGEFRRQLKKLSPNLIQRCFDEASRLLASPCIGSFAEDAQAVIAIATTANGVPSELKQRARCALRLSDRWRWVVEQP